MTIPETQTAVSTAPSTTPLALVADELTRVEQRISTLLPSREGTLQQISRELLESGGKRVRPALALLVFRACGGGDPADTIDVGAALELIHSATLLHDDILDGGLTRRGRPSPLANHGVGLTLVTGDYLFSRAFGVAGRFDEMVVGWATDACVQLCEGEVLQRRFSHNVDATIEDYLEIASCKTASLFSQAARIGAHFADPGNEERTDLMHQMGHDIGIAFQMVDDLLDVIGPEEVIGKPVGSDLREGAPALTIVLGLSLPAVRETFSSKDPSAEQVARALDAILDSDVLNRVRGHAAERVRSAADRLRTLPPSVYREALLSLTDDLLARTS